MSTKVTGSTGGSGGHWRAVLHYDWSQSATACTANATVGIESVAWGFQLTSGVSGTVSNNGTASASTGFTSATGATTYKAIASRNSQSYARGHSAYTVTLSGSVTNSSGYLNGSASVSVSLTVPALASYAVSYSADGGSGAPSAQTKWHGEALTLSGTSPTRSGYAFLGWATSSGGSVAYRPGASYTANAAATLYAVWQLSYVPPTVSRVTCERQSTTTSVKVTAPWSVDTTASSSNTGKTAKVEYAQSTSSTWTTFATATLSGTSGTYTGTITGLSDSASYNVRVTVTDAAGHSSSSTGTVGTTAYPLDVGNQGKSVGVGGAAPSYAGVRVGNGSNRVTLDAPAGSVYLGGWQWSPVLSANRFCAFGDNSGTVGNMWHLFATATLSGTNGDYALHMLVAEDYNSSYNEGHLTAHVRLGSTAGTVAAAHLAWSWWRGDAYKFDPTRWALLYQASGSTVYARLYHYEPTAWHTTVCRALLDSTRTSRSWNWTLVSSVKTSSSDPNSAASLPSGWTAVYSTRPQKLYTGSLVVSPSSTRAVVWTKAAFTSAFGAYVQGTTHVSLSNGDDSANEFVTVTPSYQTSTGNVVAIFSKSVTSYRLDYAVWN